MESHLSSVLPCKIVEMQNPHEGELLADLESGMLSIQSLIPYPSVYDSTKRVTGVSSKNSHTRKKSKHHITRPGNAFLHFRSDLAAQRKIPKEMGNPTISKIAGCIWKKMTSAQREPWIRKASIEKHEHRQLYPNYHYRSGQSARLVRTNGVSAQGAENCPPPPQNLNSLPPVSLTPKPETHSEVTLHPPESLPPADSINVPSSRQERKPSSCPPLDTDQAGDTPHSDFSTFGYVDDESSLPQSALCTPWASEHFPNDPIVPGGISLPNSIPNSLGLANHSLSHHDFINPFTSPTPSDSSYFTVPASHSTNSPIDPGVLVSPLTAPAFFESTIHAPVPSYFPGSDYHYDNQAQTSVSMNNSYYGMLDTMADTYMVFPPSQYMCIPPCDFPSPSSFSTTTTTTTSSGLHYNYDLDERSSSSASQIHGDHPGFLQTETGMEQGSRGACGGDGVVPYYVGSQASEETAWMPCAYGCWEQGGFTESLVGASRPIRRMRLARHEANSHVYPREKK